MATQIGWIDFSPKDRDRVKKFMDLMGMGGVVDELGIGMVRDAMSNKLFPGFSTLYTRAKYLFITPYILLEREVKQTKKQTGREYFKKAEEEVNNKISEFFKRHPERSNESFFGKNTPGGRLKRQPSEIYWNGMLHLHLLETESSLDQLLSEKHSLMDELLSSNRGDDITKEQGEHAKRGCEHVSFDTAWLEYIESNGLKLTRTEAETLCDRLKEYSENSLPAALTANKELWEEYDSSLQEAKSSEFIDNAFVHFVDKSFRKIGNKVLRENLIQAHDLSLFLHGAHIAYNVQLWKKAGASEDFIEKLRQQGREWLGTLSSRMIGFDSFSIDNCIKGTNLKTPTQHFLSEVQRLVMNNSDWNAIEEHLCQLTEQQERWNKKAKSRFVKMEKNQVIEDMNKEQWLGLSLINYRYLSTRSVVSDIYNGLETTED